MASSKRTYLREVNPHLICPLCRGYLIDATTIVECLHSFCRSCILKHLRTDAKCPSCKLLLNTAKPNIKADKALQDIVYKLVPGLYHKEMRKRREFYGKHPEHADSATPEQRGEDVSGRLIFAPEDAISLSLEYLSVGADPLILLATNNSEAELAKGQKPKQINGTNVAGRRYLQCPALVTIAHLKKFLALKYSVDVTRYNIDICHMRAPLPEHWTLMDVAYIFAWKRNAPIRFFYRITQEEQQLEAPPNDRPSTPGVGASQPATSEEAAEIVAEKKPEFNGEKLEKAKKPAEPLAAQDAKRNLPDKELKVTAEKLTAPLTPAKPEESAKQVKTPIKIMKKSDGNYQVLRGPSLPSSPAKPDKKSPPATPTAEFSVVSINDSNDSKQVKITLKQCQPSNPVSSNGNLRKPKVISNVLLKSPSDKSNVSGQLPDSQKQEKHKRKVTFDVNASPSKQPKKMTEQTEKKQFLHAVSLTAKHAATTGASKQQDQEAEDANSVEAQLRDIIKNKLNRETNNQLSPSKPISQLSPTKDEPVRKRPAEVKNTNIADRLDAKLANVDHNPAKFIRPSNNKEQQPIDVYAFPSDPPGTATVPPGAVKRKCPPGLPIFDIRKKHQQCASGKRIGVNAAKGTTVKCYRNQSKPVIYPKPASPARPLQSLQTPMPNAANANINNSVANATVSSTSSKPNPINISDDTRSLLDGCGLNIPASLSITLTAPKSPSRDSQIDLRKDLSQRGLDKLNPSITLNDKSVDPRALKALKAGQMRMPPANAKSKGRQTTDLPQQQQGQAAKRKKDESPAQQPRNALDLSGQKKSDFNSSLKIPTPMGSKFKSKPPPPTWSQANSPKPKDDSQKFTANGQVVTLNSGQRFYRAPPGSLTPSVNRFNDIPMPTRTPVYASFGNVSSNYSHIFPSLKSLYALNQAPSLEQFSMDSRMRMIKEAASNNTTIKATSSTTSNTTSSCNNGNSNSNPQGSKSHLAAQCAPVKPARSAVGSFAMPAKPPTGLSIKMTNKSVPSVSSANESETPVANSTEAKQNQQKSDSKEAPAKADCEQSENCESSTEESNPPQGSASPRVTSTVSSSPPPNVSETCAAEKPPAEAKASQPRASEVSSSKSPESPDSSSLVTESNLVDSTKDKSREPSPVKSLEVKSEGSSNNEDVKLKDEQIDETDPKKSMSSEALQKRLLAAFPSNEWANNPQVAQHFGLFLERLNTMPAEPKKASTCKARNL
ncbi:polycomb group protein Psc-like isoform X2 [Phymastichus coffea]|uniref:polycomb group protein Psc-like isoform X2 n=1 Tax=Phymastichus coffea TaxID=108790 RepID=UPI00273AB07F|nr:polycomb group protein Psc-like isoform X2 [Phymastichus coffea]